MTEAVSRVKQLSLGLVALSSAAGLALADPINEQLKLFPADASAEDLFGTAVSISGNTILIGAPRDDDGGRNSGSAYVFDAESGAELRKLVASDAQLEAKFGGAVAVSGSLGLVGAAWDGVDGVPVGSAYLFDVDDGTQRFRLLADDGEFEDRFGEAVAVSQEFAVVGAWADSDSGQFSGSAYVFDVSSGEQLFKLAPTDAAEGQFFGEAVAIHGSIAVIGARGDSAGGFFSGAAYIFDLSSGKQLHKLTAEDPEVFDFFGFSVAITDTIAVIGAPRSSDDGSLSGSTYVFDIETGAQLRKLTASDAGESDNFGHSVGARGAHVVVGAPGGSARGQTGAAYIFDASTGNELQKIAASDASPTDMFGLSVAIGDARALVGARLNDAVASNSGAGYVFANPPLDCPGDVTGDDTVDLADLNLVLANFGSTTGDGDVNGDGQVDLADLNLVLAKFGTNCE